MEFREDSLKAGSVFITAKLTREQAMQHTEYRQPTKTTTSNGGTTQPSTTPSCCELIDFKRPNYVCGHLLTDADLTLDQRYFREKNKLYNRAFHGHGIVCGL